MSFFKFRDKRLAKKCSYKTLQEGYKHTEIGLKNACASGDEKAMRKAMKNHQCFEYALLYRSTPECKAQMRKKYIRKKKTRR